MRDIVGRRRWFYLISALVVAPGIVSLALFGIPLAIDFTGGALWELEFEAAGVPPAEIRAVYGARGLTDTLVQTSGENVFLIRSKVIGPATKAEIEGELRAAFGGFTELRFEEVGPSVGVEVQQRAALAVGVAALAILLYISIAFRKVAHPVRFGTCAILAMIHDVAVVLGLASILGALVGFEADALFLTAILTVIGYSVHDSIVVFDRIRENMSRRIGEPIESIVNHSIFQTLDRSINTQLTVVFTLVALLLFGGVTIRFFILMLLIGVVSGTYSSIFNASPLLVDWERNPDKMLYALGFFLPPVGAVLGAWHLVRRRAAEAARPYLLASGAGGALLIVLLVARGLLA